MLLNTTIHALFASTRAIAAHVIAGLFVRSASPAGVSVVPKRDDVVQRMRRSCRSGQPSDIWQSYGQYSDGGLNVSGPALFEWLRTSVAELNQLRCCPAGTSGRS